MTVRGSGQRPASYHPTSAISSPSGTRGWPAVISQRKPKATTHMWLPTAPEHTATRCRGLYMDSCFLEHLANDSCPWSLRWLDGAAREPISAPAIVLANQEHAFAVVENNRRRR
jgi:hypothetical protein